MRPTPKRFVKAIFAVSAIGFLLMNISFLLSDDDEVTIDESTGGRAAVYNRYANESRNAGGHGLKYEKVQENDGVVDRLDSLNLVNQLNLGRWAAMTNTSRNATVASDFELPRNANTTQIKQAVWEANRRQHIRNLDRFDLVASESTIVVVVQVHNRPEYLRHLVDSLRKARDIAQTLLVFSHDYYSDELNEIVSTINFCPVSLEGNFADFVL